MKKRILLIVLLITTIYCTPYFYNKIKIDYYMNHYPFGVKDNYILHSFYEINSRFPESESELRDFIRENDSLYQGNIMAEYLVNNEFHIHHTKSFNEIVVYIPGFNFVDDHLNRIIKPKDINIFNYMFTKGDIVLFYSDDTYTRPVIITKEMIDKLPTYETTKFPDNKVIIGDSLNNNLKE